MSQYLAFELQETPGRKTHVWHVVSKHYGDTLGAIKWYGPWRQYILEAEAGVVWNHTCLLDIVSFLQTQNALHRRATA